jgi:CBS domain-containing protein
MTTVARLLDSKGHEVWSVAPEDSVYRAIERMAEKGVGALTVVDGGRLAGVLSERDYARKVILQGKSSRDTPVADIMTRDVVTVRPDQSVEDCMALMTERRIRHLPVVDGDRLVGMISIGDVVKWVISDRESLIAQLEGYITGTLGV